MFARAIPFFAAVFLGGTLAVRAAEEELTFKTKDGRTFQRALLSKVYEQRIEVITETGVQSVRMAELPEDLRGRFAAEAAKVPAPKVGERLSFNSTDGRAFTNAVLRRVEPNGLTFETSDGFEKLPFSKLPPALAAHYDFSDAERARFHAQQAAAQQAYAARHAAESEAAKRAAAQAAATPAPARQAPRRQAPRIGDRGSKSLGSPQLGGRGIDGQN